MFLCRHVNRMLFVICKNFTLIHELLFHDSIRFRFPFKFCRYGFLYDRKISIFLLCNIVKREIHLCFLRCTIYFVQLDFLTYNSRIEFTQVANFNKPSREFAFSKTRCLIVSRIHCTSWIQLDYTHTDVAKHDLMTDKINIAIFSCNILIY